jgi:RimJ/RimL family protein N-acetyltransferase
LEDAAARVAGEGHHVARAARHRRGFAALPSDDRRGNTFHLASTDDHRWIRALHYWSQREREAGRCVCYAVIPDGSDTVIGLFQVRQLDQVCDTAAWGFVFASAFWGSGLFVKGAEFVIEFAFGVAGAHRLEARVAVQNGRGNSALRKIGAVEEGILRQSFLRGGLHHDQSLWSILREDWYRSKAVWGSKAS